jgi:hypothetical protein
MDVGMDVGMDVVEAVIDIKHYSTSVSRRACGHMVLQHVM